MSLLPVSRPQQTREVTVAALVAAGLDLNQVVVHADRGYFLKSMGNPARNDRGMYDDAVFVYSPRVHRAFNYNTDPSAYRQGIATLKAGLYRYQPGIHGVSHPVGPRRYPAFIQAGDVTVTRDGGKTETGEFYIHIHHGYENGTSSLGCQTVPPEQWDEFHNLVLAELAHYGQKTFPYLLTEGQG